MARGWESKSVEEQIEAAHSKPDPRRPQLTPEQLVRAREMDSLALSRKRVMHDLETAANPRYREILEKALAHLDERLTEI